jgi:hypothetical protein
MKKRVIRTIFFTLTGMMVFLLISAKKPGSTGDQESNSTLTDLKSKLKNI